MNATIEKIRPYALALLRWVTVYLACDSKILGIPDFHDRWQWSGNRSNDGCWRHR